MHNLIWSFLVVMISLFHQAIRSVIKRGKVRVAFCAHWCIDAVFAVGGTITALALYHYDFMSIFRVKHLFPIILNLLITVLVVLFAPSGYRLFTRRGTFPEEEIRLAEYRFNDTLVLVRNFFQALLFAIPVILILLSQSPIHSSLFTTWSETEICAGFCFTSYLILLPISLRQAFFWLKALVGTPTEAETLALKQYGVRLHYRRRNWRL